MEPRKKTQKVSLNYHVSFYEMKKTGIPGELQRNKPFSFGTRNRFLKQTRS